MHKALTGPIKDKTVKVTGISKSQNRNAFLPILAKNNANQGPSEETPTELRSDL